MKINKKNGISLIVLVITIIVVMTLAGAIILTSTQNNPMSQASKATFLSDVRSFQEELELYKAKEYTEKAAFYNPGLLQADSNSVTYDSEIDNSKTINDLIPSLGKSIKYAGQFQVIDGELVFSGTDIDKQDWSKETGIGVVIIGEPKVIMIPLTETVVAPGTDIIYAVQFSSTMALTNINLVDKVEVLDDNGVALPVQPVITIGTVSGTDLDAERQVNVTIKTNTLKNGGYKLKIKAGSATNIDNISNTKDTISMIGFDVDSSKILLENPIMSAEPTEWTNGNVTVIATYSLDLITKEYSLNGVTWQEYTEPVVVTENNITIYARGKDVYGNRSGVATITVVNIDKVLPTVVYGTNGGTKDKQASTGVIVNDVNGSGVDTSTLQYIWDIQDIEMPSGEWTSFINNATLTYDSVEGPCYLWIRASDNVGNIIVSKTNMFTIDKTAPNNPEMSADPSTWTEGSVTVTIEYAMDSITKEYSLDGTLWQAYTIPIIVTENNTTVYAKRKRFSWK